MAKSKMTTCKHCGAEIAASAKVCPHCGGKNKPPIYKRWWFILIIVIVVLSVIGGSGSSSGDSSNSKATSTKTSGALLHRRLNRLNLNLKSVRTIIRLNARA